MASRMCQYACLPAPKTVTSCTEWRFFSSIVDARAVLNAVTSSALIKPVVLPFGSFSGGEIDFPYLNCTLHVKRRDIYFLQSSKVFHNVLQSFGNCQALVFTNHKSIVQRFCKIDISNILKKL